MYIVDSANLYYLYTFLQYRCTWGPFDCKCFSHMHKTRSASFKETEIWKKKTQHTETYVQSAGAIHLCACAHSGIFIACHSCHRLD